jgi:hypothetical protein
MAGVTRKSVSTLMMSSIPIQVHQKKTLPIVAEGRSDFDGALKDATASDLEEENVCAS